jgi:hypothetical protein
MQYLRTFIKTVLVEGKVEDLQVKYPDLDVKEVAENDPSGFRKGEDRADESEEFWD